MFVVFDYVCPSCGHSEERFVRRSEMDEQRHTTCRTLLLSDPPQHPRMTRLPAGTRTHFRFADAKLKPR